MKRILYILTILVLFLVQASLVFAQDVEDILRSLESPDVDYHVDEAIKTIIPQKVLPVYRPSPANKKIENFKVPEPITAPLKKQETTEKDNTPKTSSTAKTSNNTSASNNTSSKTVIKKSDNVPQTKSISSKSEEKTSKPLVTTKTQKSELATNKKNDIKEKDDRTNQNIFENKPPTAIKVAKNIADSKPIKIWSLYKNIMTLNFVKDLIAYSHDVPIAIPAFANDVFVYWQNNSANTPSTNLKEDKAAETSDSDTDDEGEEGEDEEEEEEEEESPKDLSIYDNIIAQAKELYENQKWEEIRKLFEDNPDAGERLDSYKYQLEAELNSKNPNYNLIRSFANGVIEESPDDAAANYGLALSFINRKKPDLQKASDHINICLKKTPAYPGAKELYNQILIKRFLLYIIIGVVILLIAIIAVIKIILSKKKQKKAEVKETTSEKTEEKENETQAEKVTDSADKTASPETSQDNQDDKPKSAENPNKLKQKLLAITDKFAPVSEKLKPALSKSKEFISSVLSKLKKKPAAVVEPKEETAPQQSNDEEKVDEIERVIVEVDENGNEISETTIVEVPSDGENTDENEIEVIEELIEEPEPEEEIVEEIIEEEVVEDNSYSSREDEFEEEIIEEIIEEV